MPPSPDQLRADQSGRDEIPGSSRAEGAGRAMASWCHIPNASHALGRCKPVKSENSENSEKTSWDHESDSRFGAPAAMICNVTLRVAMRTTTVKTMLDLRMRHHFAVASVKCWDLQKFIISSDFGPSLEVLNITEPWAKRPGLVSIHAEILPEWRAAKGRGALGEARG